MFYVIDKNGMVNTLKPILTLHKDLKNKVTHTHKKKIHLDPQDKT